MASFAPGGSDVTFVTFMVFDDDEPEIEETYTFTLVLIGSGTSISVPNMATVIIQANDDAYGAFSFVDVSLLPLFVIVRVLRPKKSSPCL